MNISMLILPAVLAGLATFFVSFVVWMLLRWHERDIKRIPEESRFMEEVRTLNIPVGFYMWPLPADPRKPGAPEFKERWNAGPWGTINVLKAKPNFARNLIGNLLIDCIVAFAIAVSIGLVLAGGSTTGEPVNAWDMVFWPATILATSTYCLGGLGNDLFMGKQNRYIATCTIDGILFGFTTGLLLCLFWPS